MEDFGKFCTALILMTLSVFIGGFVFIKTYEWFIVSAFQAPKITFAQALGVMLFVGYLKPKAKKDEEKFSIEKLGKQFFEQVLMALFVLGLGYLILQFI